MVYAESLKTDSSRRGTDDIGQWPAQAALNLTQMHSGLANRALPAD